MPGKEGVEGPNTVNTTQWTRLRDNVPCDPCAPASRASRASRNEGAILLGHAGRDTTDPSVDHAPHVRRARRVGLTYQRTISCPSLDPVRHWCMVHRIVTIMQQAKNRVTAKNSIRRVRHFRGGIRVPASRHPP